MNIGTWASARMFSILHGYNLVYNTCWEDPRLDRVALDIQPHDDILAITSAGCNVLDYALKGPRSIQAVDLNYRQNALLELKIAGIRNLSYDTFYEIFGNGQLQEFARTYKQCLRPALSPMACRFWDDRLHYFDKGRGDSFYFHGTSGFFAWLINQYLDHRRGLREMVHACLNATSLEEQQNIYYGGMCDRFWNRSMRWAANRDTTLAMVGVPRAQRRQVERYYEGGVAQFVQECLEAVFAHLPLGDNYFWRVYLTGQYTPDCCPEYLKKDNFYRLKNGLVDAIQIHTTSITNLLEERSAPISKFVLLDHMDWLSTFQDDSLQREWQAIHDKATPDARIIWRSGGLTTDFLDDIEIRAGRTTHRLSEALRYDRALSAELHAMDRVHTYGSFHIAEFAHG